MNSSVVLGAALSLVAAIVGATAQYLFSRSNETRKHLATLKAQAYTDYLSAIAAAAHVPRDASPPRECRERAADAKARICLYGSPAVIDQLAEFEKAGAVLNSPSVRRIFGSVVTAMRADQPAGSRALREDSLRLLLFGSQGD